MVFLKAKKERQEEISSVLSFILATVFVITKIYIFSYIFKSNTMASVSILFVEMLDCAVIGHTMLLNSDLISVTTVCGELSLNHPCQLSQIYVKTTRNADLGQCASQSVHNVPEQFYTLPTAKTRQVTVYHRL